MTRDELIALAKRVVGGELPPQAERTELAKAFLEADALAREFLESVKELNEDTLRLQAEHDAARAEVATCKERLQVAQAEVEQLRPCAHEALAKIEGLTLGGVHEELARMRVAYRGLESSVKTLRGKVREAESELATLRREIDEAPSVTWNPPMWRKTDSFSTPDWCDGDTARLVRIVRYKQQP